MQHKTRLFVEHYTLQNFNRQVERIIKTSWQGTGGGLVSVPVPLRPRLLTWGKGFMSCHPHNYNARAILDVISLITPASCFLLNSVRVTSASQCIHSFHPLAWQQTTNIEIPTSSGADRTAKSGDTMAKTSRDNTGAKSIILPAWARNTACSIIQPE